MSSVREVPTLESLDIDALSALAPEDLLGWAHENFGARSAILTSFQNTGCVMIDMAHRSAPGLRIATVDTLRLHPETYDTIARLEERYGIAVERFTPNPDTLKDMVDQHGEYLFFDSRPMQEHCCWVRKVEPNKRALATVDVWITGLRRDQSSFRKDIAKARLVKQDGRLILKIAPLAEWDEDRVWQYIRDRDVPYNTLYDKGFASIGCVICTTPVQPGEDKRAGRWRWFNQYEKDHKKECGIHTHGSGI